MGARHLRQGEYFHAYGSFRRAAAMGDGAERELARGLAHLAAAGYKHRVGDRRGRDRQLAHARRRLGPFLPGTQRLDLAGLLDFVERRAR